MEPVCFFFFFFGKGNFISAIIFNEYSIIIIVVVIFITVSIYLHGKTLIIIIYNYILGDMSQYIYIYVSNK